MHVLSFALCGVSQQCVWARQWKTLHVLQIFTMQIAVARHLQEVDSKIALHTAALLEQANCNSGRFWVCDGTGVKCSRGQHATSSENFHVILQLAFSTAFPEALQVPDHVDLAGYVSTA